MEVKFNLPELVADQPLVFVFNDTMVHSIEILKQLYEEYPTFQDAFDECDTIFSHYLEESLVSILYVEQRKNKLLSDLVYSRALAFSTQIGLAMLWYDTGVDPSLICGHGAGEIAAACACGMLDLDDAVKLVVKCAGLLSLIPAKNKKAAYTPFIERYLDELTEQIRSTLFSPPRIPIVSARTGDKLGLKEMSEPEYWLNRLVVSDFIDTALMKIIDNGYKHFIEIGMGATLSSYKADSPENNDLIFIPSINVKRNTQNDLIGNISKLFGNSVDINFHEFYNLIKLVDETKKKEKLASFHK